MLIETDVFNDLIGKDLSGITFVRDYLQLQFNLSPMLNAYTPVTVRCGDNTATFGAQGFANLLIAQLNKFVRSVELKDEESLTLVFIDESRIVISLRPDDYVGPEALYYTSGDLIVVI